MVACWKVVVVVVAAVVVVVFCILVVSFLPKCIEIRACNNTNRISHLLMLLKFFTLYVPS